MSRDVITYGPATLAALERELAEPITSPIANPAPIGHGLVMDDEEHAEAMMDRLMAANRQPATSKRVLHAGDYTVGDALGLRRMGEPATYAQPIIARSMRCLAANLAVGGALCAAYSIGASVGDDPHARGDYAYWYPGCGRPMPGWGGIVNEYGDDVSPEEMIRTITERAAWTAAGHVLRRHDIDGQHCIGHGEGIYDLMVGWFL